MERKKKIGIGAAAAAVVIAIAGVSIYFAKQNDSDKSNQAYVEKVGNLNGMITGNVNRFSGVVEAQDTWKINLSADKQVKEVYVQVGDKVAEGDKLFAYDTEDVNDQIDQANLDVESYNNDINDANEQIASLSAERDAATTEEAKFDYTTQIQSVQNELKQAEYDLKAKKIEIEKLNKTIAESVVTSKMAGVVKTISSTNGSDDMGTEDAFMTILADGSYRIKCYVNEQNMAELSEGLPMIIRSRVDEKQTWSGTLAKIDMESPNTNSSSGEYTEESSDDTTTSSKYPFYISLEDTKGMMLGQHVLAEVDNGQGSEKKGVYLDEFYLVQEEDTAYVWADNGNGRLEKRTVELGKYDEESGRYKIKSGLKNDDYIAWPQDGLKEGMKTTKDAAKATENLEGEDADNESVEEELPEDGSEDESLEDIGEDIEKEEKILKEQ